MIELGFLVICVGDFVIFVIIFDSVVVVDLGRFVVEENFEIVINYRVVIGYEEGKIWGWKKEG